MNSFLIQNFSNYNLTQLEKYKGVKDICQLELGRAKSKRMNEFKNGKKPSTLTSDIKNLYNYYSENMQRVLVCMSDISREILDNELLDPCDDPFWWDMLCSKTTYYKRRAAMVDEFLFYYFDSF
ncbi:MG284/MPN403 family protein [Mycoplasma zalophidermidis]|uniref:Uncharacterized protein n=1 Tax=Mycoplasma zalophidermidis TaxID=398174 RepID=A0ABS6DR58_9MOLU|nr:hypothetical protein [Mycoplasma zalophidermidis]MBU4689496.1 hypothetical protein [Mycoplasma zalophidermidis]MBU4693374.1 hypothetical protein [Mycoplasma zalophidermidis]MCR8966328.1 hypothetical protein [Mycoplasma zalophidermidis]